MSILPSAFSHFEADVWLLTGETGNYCISTNVLAATKTPPANPALYNIKYECTKLIKLMKLLCLSKQGYLATSTFFKFFTFTIPDEAV